MKQVVILTKNITADLELQNKLQLLGNEVFCSSQLLDKLLNKQGKVHLSLFKVVIISSTVSNDEIKVLLPWLPLENNEVFRVDQETPSESDLEKWHWLGLIRWLHQGSSLQKLREELANDTSDDNYAEQTDVPVSTNNLDYLLKRFVDNLSKKEKQLFGILYKMQGDYVMRKDISNLLWGGEVSNSNLTQLSQLIRRIKEKMLDEGLDQKLIHTNWTKGYALSNEIFVNSSSQIEEIVIDSLNVSM